MTDESTTPFTDGLIHDLTELAKTGARRLQGAVEDLTAMRAALTSDVFPTMHRRHAVRAMQAYRDAVETLEVTVDACICHGYNAVIRAKAQHAPVHAVVIDERDVCEPRTFDDAAAMAAWFGVPGKLPENRLITTPDLPIYVWAWNGTVYAASDRTSADVERERQMPPRTACLLTANDTVKTLTYRTVAGLKDQLAADFESAEAVKAFEDLQADLAANGHEIYVWLDPFMADVREQNVIRFASTFSEAQNTRREQGDEI